MVMVVGGGSGSGIGGGGDGDVCVCVHMCVRRGEVAGMAMHLNTVLKLKPCCNIFY